MGLKNRFLRFWQDPVWSKVIATAIIAGLSLLFITLFDRFASSIAFPKPVILALLVGGCCFGLYLVIRRGHTPRTKILVYVSSGGTCRDPMAKAITAKLLEKRKLNHPLQIKAMALGPISKPEASYAARYVIREMYHEDLLAQHKPDVLTQQNTEDADLILVMDQSLLLTPGKTFPPVKTFLLKEFFGLEGDIIDPWPDGKDRATLSRYEKCAEELKDVIGHNIEHLISVLDL